jgi:DNA (cytosine-5)-methyltransferase 1
MSTILHHLRRLGYTIYWTVLNALDYGLPQKRERTFIVGFKDAISFDFPAPSNKKTTLAEVLEPDDQVDKTLFASEKIRRQRLERIKVEPFYPSMWHENKGGNVSVLPYSCALRHGGSYSYLLVNGIRRPSAREMLRLQGFPDSFKIAVPTSEIRKQAGNSVPVPVIEAIARQMMKALKERKPVTRRPMQGTLTLWSKEDESITSGSILRQSYQEIKSSSL